MSDVKDIKKYIIDPSKIEPFEYDRHFMDPETLEDDHSDTKKVKRGKLNHATTFK